MFELMINQVRWINICLLVSGGILDKIPVLAARYRKVKIYHSYSTNLCLLQMQPRNRLHSNVCCFSKFVLTAEERTPYLQPDVESATENT